MGALAQLANCILMLVRPDLADNFVGPRLQLLLEHLRLSEYDVVCLQEMTAIWGNDAFVRKVIESVRDKFPYSCSTSRWPQFPATFASTGILVLSKFEIDSSVPFSFSRQSWFEFHLVARGGLLARLRHPSQPESAIDICTVHTTAGLEVLASEVGGADSKTTSFANPFHSNLRALSGRCASSVATSTWIHSGGPCIRPPCIISKTRLADVLI
eukprot:gnl/TRDRNA2_/TRDRNA2_151944_c0_seq4.p1 gnl/TRDRNA2_/TRDRNA2_151944_c0~~gnl/TRDRNA2_/TRDRNA2_151944_c0_seq4.p1  ORF type:complete len:250 (-),score=14.88 gnl/TRDRNA2_/TRDRNA2_151944_c0_seq4:24-662(-)